jgi:hypothetical protein
MLEVFTSPGVQLSKTSRRRDGLWSVSQFQERRIKENVNLAPLGKNWRLHEDLAL